MPRLTIVIGILLILLALGGYFGAGMQSPTALIPAVFGVPLALLGWVSAARPGWRKHAMHAAALLGLLGLGGSFGGLVKLVSWIGGTQPARPVAVIAQSVMAILLAGFLALAIKSFVAARRNRTATG